MGRNVLLRNINKKYFFGSEYILEGNFYLPYSDLEKTLIDMVVFNQKFDGKALKNIQKKINKSKLLNYLRKYPLKIRERVIKLV